MTPRHIRPNGGFDRLEIEFEQRVSSQARCAVLPCFKRGWITSSALGRTRGRPAAPEFRRSFATKHSMAMAEFMVDAALPQATANSHRDKIQTSYGYPHSEAFSCKKRNCRVRLRLVMPAMAPARDAVPTQAKRGQFGGVVGCEERGSDPDYSRGSCSLCTGGCPARNG